jgi:hypothetical protein|tara:strand:- start:443 stop:601 length:159 start_codon:yes stop_codon:yes gene_type:complete
MKNLYYKISRWFELNIGWFFINGFKRDEWEDYLNRKYKPKNKNNMFEGLTKL